MGLGSDWLSDHRFEQDFPFGLPSDTWRAGDGRRIPLKEMTESHILNCMKVVGEDDGWYHRFQEELFSRGITNRAQVVRELEGLNELPDFEYRFEVEKVDAVNMLTEQSDVGDLVQCSWCEKVMIVNIGEDVCPACNTEGTLSWIEGCPKEVEL